ncbi:MAG: DUF86 domain-containing protein [Thiolinea sp.]
MKIGKKSLRTPDYLKHIIDAIQQIETYTADMMLEAFMEGRLTLDAVVRNIEIVGEAARNITEHDPLFAAEHPEIPWDAMYTMRNRLSHGYFSVDARVVWQTVQQDLPELKHQIRALLHPTPTPKNYYPD